MNSTLLIIAIVIFVVVIISATVTKQYFNSLSLPLKIGVYFLFYIVMFGIVFSIYYFLINK